MGRPRSPDPSPAALRMRETRERAKCGIRRMSLEVDLALLSEKRPEITDVEDFLNRLIEEAIEGL